MNYLKLRQFLHILFIISIGSVGLSSIVNSTIFSKEGLIDVIESSSSIANVEISPVDALFIARVIRQQLWEIHFYFGVSSFLLSILILLIYKKQKAKKVLNSNISLCFMLASLLYLFTIGLLMFYRSDIHISTHVFELLKNLHWIGIYIFLFAILFHLYNIFKKQR